MFKALQEEITQLTAIASLPGINSYTTEENQHEVTDIEVW